MHEHALMYLKNVWHADHYLFELLSLLQKGGVMYFFYFNMVLEFFSFSFLFPQFVLFGIEARHLKLFHMFPEFWFGEWQH